MSSRNNTISVQYCINNGKKISIKVDNNITVADFLHLIKKKEKNSDICALYFRGRKLEEDDLLINNIKCKDDVVVVSDDPDKDPDEFVDVDTPNATSEQKKIVEEKLHNSLHETNEVPRDSFGKKNKFTIFTNASPHSLLEGDVIIFNRNDDFEKISNEVRNLINNIPDKEIPDEYDIHIFLPGGTPFLSKTLDDYYMATQFLYNRLYVVITKKLGDLVEEEVKEPCNCTRRNADVLSPLFESSQPGLTQIACLLGYIFHHGVYAEHLLLILAKVTRFAPLITNIFRLLENAPLTNLNIISITAPLYTFFRSLLPNDRVALEHVFEYTLNLISFIGLLNDIEYLHIHTIDWKEKHPADDDDLCEYFESTGQQDHVIIWESDTIRPGYKGFNITGSEFDKIETILSAVTTYKPVPPLSLHFIYYPTFIRGRDEKSVMLFLKEIPNKKNVVMYIDPLVGKIQEDNIDDLARKVKCDEKESALDLIDKSHVEQIIFICFDKSTSMKYKLEGGNCIHGEPSRAAIATQFLHALVEQSYKFRVSSLYGLISFGNEYEVVQELTPMSSDFVDKLSKIVPKGNTRLWDAINEAKNLLIKISTPEEEEEEDFCEAPFPNAHLRIIVISDGTDNGSETSPVPLVKELIDNNITVDTVLVSLDQLNNECCALSKYTGGLCFRPKSLEEGLQLFEQEAFLNITLRHRESPIYNKKDGINEDDFTKTSKAFKDFDECAENQEIINAKYDFPLSSPLYMCYQYQSKDPETIRKKRALIELNNIGHHPIDDCVVFSSHANPIEWRIFIKGPADTPFEEKWLNVFMILPNEYPLSPPKFRFLTIPFHPNISSEGTVVFSLVGKQYTSSLPIREIIEGLSAMLANPEEDSPVNLEALQLFKSDLKKFKKKQSKGEVGVDDYNEYIKAKIYDEIPEDADIPEPLPMDMFMTNANASYRGKVIEDDGDIYYDE